MMLAQAASKANGEYHQPGVVKMPIYEIEALINSGVYILISNNL